ncbi:hypothetical protein Fmac_021590 [Flemingia macrophylla]|uniref:isoflavone 7-O-methyltransferase n=1 Tax=Flemingia macrophylla TaxID=520843 RepID=A0ABD1LXC2_9FABA
MESLSKEHATKLRQAHAHVLNHCLPFINSATLKCAVDLNIPDIIHKYGQPMPLSQLTASLPIHPSKTNFIYRLMRILTHNGFFTQHSVMENEQEVKYELTYSCRLLLKDHPMSSRTLLQFLFAPRPFSSWWELSTWFTNEDPTAFHSKNNMSFWDYASRDPEFSHIFNDSMKASSQLTSSEVIEKCVSIEVFKGLESLVDVGGGTGTMAKLIAKSFPQLKCIVFDLPHVVANLQGTKNFEYVSGDMFEAIPSADCIMLKYILHDWNDEESIKILEKCKQAIPSHGKVIIMDIVMEQKPEDETIISVQFWLDMIMMTLGAGKERSEKEWATLIFSAGFSNYKINPTSGSLSIIEVYP